jgi:hypothetical protein
MRALLVPHLCSPPPAPVADGAALPPSGDAIFEWLMCMQVAHAARHGISGNATIEMLAGMKKLWGWMRPDDASRKWPASLINAAAMFNDTKGDQFMAYGMCPSKECGAIYTPQQLAGERTPDKKGWICQPILRCTADVNIHPEQPIEELERKRLEGETARAAAPVAAPPASRKCKADGEAPPLPPVPEVLRCGTSLVRTERCAVTKARPDGLVHYPLLLMPYLGIMGALKRLLLEPGFEDKCEQWRELYDATTGKRKQTNIIADVYHGKRWEEYQYMNSKDKPWSEVDGRDKKPLLATPGTLAFALNTDNYTPHANGTYSMGAVYLVILNLPREERYLQRNMILISLLPGPFHSSRVQQHQAFGPIVQELLELYKGVKFNTYNQPEEHTVRGFLHTVVCDLPAARGTCGFGLHNATFGCAYCDVPTSENYSFSTFKDATPRTDEMHRERARKWANISNSKGKHRSKNRDEFFKRKGDRDGEGGSRGSRWCALMELPYFDTVRGTPVDAMHNICLGIDHAVFGLLSLPTKRYVPKTAEQQKADKTALRNFKEPSIVKKAAAAAAAAAAEVAAEAAEAESAADAAAAAEIDAGYHSPRLARGRRDQNDDDGESDSGNESDDPLYQDEAPVAAPAPKKSRAAPMASAAAAPAPPVKRKSKSRKALEAAAKSNVKVTAFEPILNTKKHLAYLQKFVNACQCPSDVGRIPRKIASSMTSFKASEWSTLTTIFAVPALRQMMIDEPADGFGEDHLQLMIELHKATELVLSNVIDKHEVEEVRELLITVQSTVERLFTSRVVKPNMHLSLHLADMILDNGPTPAFSCFAYERLNGTLTNMPKNFKEVETGTARRYQIHMAALRKVQNALQQPSPHAPLNDRPCKDDYEWIMRMMAGTEADAAIEDDVPVLPAGSPPHDSIAADIIAAAEPIADDDDEERKESDAAPAVPARIDEAVEKGSTPSWPLHLAKSLIVSGRSTASGQHKLSYRWTGEHRVEAYTQFRDNRLDATCIGETVGWEPIPGRLHMRSCLTAGDPDAFSLDNAGSVRFDRAFKGKISRDHMLNCLMRHYAYAYVENIVEENEAIIREDPHVQAHIGVGISTRAAVDELSMDDYFKVLQQRFRVATEFRVSKALTMGGESFGCAYLPRSANKSYIAVAQRVYPSVRKDRVRIKPPTTVFSYAQVQFYFQHVHRNVTHSFAALKCYNEMKIPDNESSTLKEARILYPLLNRTPAAPEVTDIVPIQRICHRFAACKLESSVTMIACPIPIKLHA